MTRPLRIELAGGFYHVTSRGDRREDIFVDDRDRECWLDCFKAVCDRFGWRCFAWVLMSNHYHVVIETPQPNLARGMRQLNGVYTQYVNRRHGRVGHVFQGRYKAILVERDSYLLELSRYVVLNPVRANLVSDVASWPWSSYKATLGLDPVPHWLQVQWLLSQFSGNPDKGRRAYAQFVAEGVASNSPWEKLSGQIYLGSVEFVEKTLATVERWAEMREIPRMQRSAPAKPLEHYSNNALNRNAAIVSAYLSGGYSQRQIADYFGIHYTTVSRVLKQEGK